MPNFMAWGTCLPLRQFSAHSDYAHLKYNDKIDTKHTQHISQLMNICSDLYENSVWFALCKQAKGKYSSRQNQRFN